MNEENIKDAIDRFWKNTKHIDGIPVEMILGQSIDNSEDTKTFCDYIKKLQERIK